MNTRALHPQPGFLCHPDWSLELESAEWQGQDGGVRDRDRPISHHPGACWAFPGLRLGAVTDPVFTGTMHADFPRALYEIGEDRNNRVLVLTGTGDRFMTDIDGASLGDITKPAQWDRTIAEGRRIVQRLVDLEMPIIAAVNGSASVQIHVDGGRVAV